MKSIGKLKLNQLSKAELENREMNELRGGEQCCICGCRSDSSTSWNSQFNIADSYTPGDGGGGTPYGSFA